MRLVKVFAKDDKAEFVSKIFGELLTSTDLHLPFDRIEFHVRDSDVTLIKDSTALVCINYNNPLVVEKDYKGVRTLLMRELFRLMFKFNIPRLVEDVIVGREMIKRGFGDDLCYMYYNYLLTMQPETIEDYIHANLPWIIFRGYDNYNSELFKKLAAKVCKKKYQCNRLFDLLVNLSQKNLFLVVKEYKKLTE